MERNSPKDRLAPIFVIFILASTIVYYCFSIGVRKHVIFLLDAFDKVLRAIQ